jgi:hypothetical protein
MDTMQGKLMCWEITGCGRQEDCNILALALADGKPCWEVVVSFDDYRSALNVCGDCIVTVLSAHHALSPAEVNELRERANDSSHIRCPGLLSA